MGAQLVAGLPRRKASSRFGLDERIDGVDAVDQCLVKTKVGKIHAKVFFEKNNNLNGIHGSQPAADKQRSAIREGLLVPFLEEQFLQESPNLFPLIHVFSSTRQVKKMCKKSKMLRDWIGPL